MSLPPHVEAAGLLSDDDVRESLPTWAGSASDADHLTLALDLLSAVDAPARPPVGLAVERARLLLLLGRAGDAVEALRLVELVQLPTCPEPVWEHCVLSAARAGTGDQAARAWLLAVSAQTTGGDRVRLGQLVASAAAAAGDDALADQAWAELRETYGIATELTIRRSAVGLVAQRNAVEATRALRLLAQVAADLTALAELGPEGQRARQEVCAVLRARGDGAGARLLLAAMVHTQPHADGPAQELREASAAAGMRRYGWWTTSRALVGLMGVAFLVPGAPHVWAVPLLLVAVLLARPGRGGADVPGLTSTDSELWRLVTGLRFDPLRQEVTDTANPRLSGLHLLAGLLGLGVGGYAAEASAIGVRAVTGRPAELLAAIAFCLTYVVVLAATVLLFRRVQRRRARRQQQRDDSLRMVRELEAQTRCRCWQVSSLLGRPAVLYETRHLQAAGLPAALRRALPDTLANRVRLSRCPLTELLWLAVDATDESLPVLLRGGASTLRASGATTVGTGFYL